jgi:hypothetical protein
VLVAITSRVISGFTHTWLSRQRRISLTRLGPVRFRCCLTDSESLGYARYRSCRLVFFQLNGKFAGLAFTNWRTKARKGSIFRGQGMRISEKLCNYSGTEE